MANPQGRNPGENREREGGVQALKGSSPFPRIPLGFFPPLSQRELPSPAGKLKHSENENTENKKRLKFKKGNIGENIGKNGEKKGGRGKKKGKYSLHIFTSTYMLKMCGKQGGEEPGLHPRRFLHSLISPWSHHYPLLPSFQEMQETQGGKGRRLGKVPSMTSATEDLWNSLPKEQKSNCSQKSKRFCWVWEAAAAPWAHPSSLLEKSLDQALETPPESPKSLSHPIPFQNFN